MNYSFNWDSTALQTYLDEIEFIFLKWNYKEVEKFKILVDTNLKLLSKNPEIGAYNKISEVYILVISKQTSLYYSFDATTKIIELHVILEHSKKS
ncbi:hypothetical protein [Flavobacterium sp.]|uniref:hypothetical protein n=1 Tax=Flavobacterium sp. TaxID=239 RepID=UPI002487237B|nr:hypothetical protein [Flavobacterium sp.]MDI1317242.1 hypothetical protein [Flavobacterium sp.]